MKIDINNYEAFFLDYHEGRLDPHQVAELMLFLEAHPELKEVFDEFEAVSLMEMEEANVVFEGKDSLKRHLLIDKSNCDQYFVSAVEGDLNDMEKEQLQLFLHAHPQLQRDLELYHKTKLTPDLSIVYENKEELKHKKGRVIALWYYAAAAAAALLIGLFFMLNSSPEQENKFVDNHTPANNSVKENSASNPVVKINSQDVNSASRVQSSPKNELASVKKNRKKEQDHNIDNKQQPAPQVQDMNDAVQEPVIANNNNKQNTTEPSHKDEMIASSPKNEINERNDDLDEEVAMSMTSNDYTLKDIAVSKLKTSLLEDEAISEAPNKITNWDVVALVLKGFRKLSGQPTEVEKKYDEDGEVIAYNVSAGAFGISRSKGTR